MLGVTHDLNDYLDKLNCEVDRIDRQAVWRLANALFQAWETGHFIFVFGNGGSGATASHFAEDLGKNALLPGDLPDSRKRRPRVLSLTVNTSWITALGCRAKLAFIIQSMGRRLRRRIIRNYRTLSCRVAVCSKTSLTAGNLRLLLWKHIDDFQPPWSRSPPRAKYS